MTGVDPSEPSFRVIVFSSLCNQERVPLFWGAQEMN
jgi:hypothetical protein